MIKRVAAERIGRKILLVAFHDVIRTFGRDSPDVSFLRADGAVTFRDLLKLWHLQLKDEVATMAIAPVRFDFLFRHVSQVCFRHGIGT